ncbi:hypothetical protein ACTXT7_016241 [Hymenolepis weldensis]
MLPFKNNLQMFLMFHFIFTSHKDVVDIDRNTIETVQLFIYKTLDDLDCVAQIKWLSMEFERTKWSDDGGFGKICFSHRNMVIKKEKIDWGEDLPILRIG